MKVLLVLLIVSYVITGAYWCAAAVDWMRDNYGLPNYDVYFMIDYIKFNWKHKLSSFGKVIWCLGIPGYLFAFIMYTIGWVVSKVINAISKLMIKEESR